MSVLGTASISKWDGTKRVTCRTEGSLLFPVSHKRFVGNLGKPAF